MDCKFHEKDANGSPRQINCDGMTPCAACGWNPAVKKKRVEQLRRKQAAGLPLHVTIPKPGTGCALGLPIRCDECSADMCPRRKVNSG